MGSGTAGIARGIVLGALVGDAAGGVLEFLGREPGEDEVERALRFPGGGCWSLAPGQFTDDGELMVCLARGLAEEITAGQTAIGDGTVTDFLGHAESRFPGRLEAVARYYHRWFGSPPFDIGNTTMASIGAATAEDVAAGRCARAMSSAAAVRCAESKANGSLMRCMPLAVWGHRLPASELAALARADSSLSHPNPSCTDAVAAYVVALGHLMNHPGDGPGALAAAMSWAGDSANDEVREWLDMAAAGQGVPFHPLDGFVKIAFIHAFRHLAVGTPYDQAIYQTLLGGGDTDTNACIVGGLVGGLHGAAGIPAPWQEAVLSCDCSLGQQRPEWLGPGQLPALIDQLVATAPTP